MDRLRIALAIALPSLTPHHEVMVTEKPLDELPVLPADPDRISEVVLDGDRRVLLWGPMGVGKSTLAAGLARVLAGHRRDCWCISADPGSPAFGVPGAVSVGRWSAHGWQLVGVEALCTLDAGRFRLPLVAAVRQARSELPPGVVLVDGPGVVRGVVGAELLRGLVEAAGIDLVLMLSREGKPLLNAELGALAVDVHIVTAATEACRPGKRLRGRRRTALWDAYLEPAVERDLDLSRVRLLGTPPPLGVPGAWTGRQLAVQAAGRTIAMGEVLALEAGSLRVRLPELRVAPDVVLVRDAVRSSAGVLETAKPFVSEPLGYLPPPDIAPFDAGATGGPRVTGRVGVVDISLMNGVFGDPLLHLRLRHQRRSLLFDLGDGLRLPARIVHQVTDVFITHAHMDHIGGFLWLLRSRIGEFPPCRLYGPPGLARHINGLIHGILWDRVAERAPCFEVAELHGRRLRRYRVEVNHPGCALMDERDVPDGALYREPAFQIRTAVLDHGTPVLAFAFEPAMQINVRKDRLAARGLAAGPWLGKLKQALVAGDEAAEIGLPDGQVVAAGPLGDELVLITPGKKLVYATDFADTAENRRRLQQLSHGAHTLFCEASFVEADVAQARRTGHLTTRACGEIAEAAGVARLVPFHFSRRYEDAPEQVYDEIAAVCSRVMVPESKLID